MGVLKGRETTRPIGILGRIGGRAGLRTDPPTNTSTSILAVSSVQNGGCRLPTNFPRLPNLFPRSGWIERRVSVLLAAGSQHLHMVNACLNRRLGADV